MPFPINDRRLLSALAARLGAWEIHEAPITKIEALQMRDLIARCLSQKDVSAAPLDIHAEAAADAAFGGAVASTIATLSEPREEDWPAPTATALRQYLASRYPDSTVSVANVRPVLDGNSKQTIFFDMILDDAPVPLVMRRDIKRPFVGTSVRDEFRIIKPLHGAGFPVPEPLWVEDSSNVIFGCFMISRRIDGVIGGASASGALNAPAETLVRMVAEVFARLHAINHHEIGVVQPEGADGHSKPVAAHTLAWRRHYESFVAAPSPVLIAGYEWLVRNAPSISQVSIIHGDAGFHNIMVAGDRLTGVIDWELAHLGHPAEDICGCRLFVEREIPFEAFLALYESFGGRRFSESELSYFEIFRLVRDASILACAMAQFNNGDKSNLVQMNNYHIVYSMCLARVSMKMMQLSSW